MPADNGGPCFKSFASIKRSASLESLRRMADAFDHLASEIVPKPIGFPQHPAAASVKTIERVSMTESVRTTQAPAVAVTVKPDSV
jgi:hypothetical protein